MQIESQQLAIAFASYYSFAEFFFCNDWDEKYYNFFQEIYILYIVWLFLAFTK